MLVLQCNAPLELVRLMQTQMYEKLLWTTSRLLKVLSVDQQNKAAIVAAGGIHALARHLLAPAPANAAPGAPSARLLHNCLWTLRNLSDVATRVEGIEPVLERLIELLALNTGALPVTPAPAPDLQVIACCAGILSNLTCNNHANKVAVCHLRGIETLVHTIKLAGPSMRDEILEPTVRAPADSDADFRFRFRCFFDAATLCSITLLHVDLLEHRSKYFVLESNEYFTTFTR